METINAATEASFMMPLPTMPFEKETFDNALERFIHNVNEARRAYYRTNYPNIAETRELIVADKGGKKYIRLMARRPGAESGSAWCFIDVATGDVLKCDGWKRPAKGARGTIYSTDFAGYGCTHNGPRYAR